MAQPIFLYWHQGWDQAPDVSKRCLQSWVDQHQNTNYQVVPLDFFSLGDWVELNSPEYERIEFFLNRLNKDKGAGSLAFFSDYLRVILLSLHGGLWADATLYCLKPLPEWLPKPQRAHFPISAALDRLFEVWFIDNRAKDPLIHQWKSWLENPHFQIRKYTRYINDWELKKHQLSYWILNLTKRSWAISATVWNGALCSRILRKRPYFMVNYALQKAIVSEKSSTAWYRHALPIGLSDLYFLMSFSEVGSMEQAKKLAQTCPFVKLSHHMDYWVQLNPHGISLSQLLNELKTDFTESAKSE